MRRLLCGWPPPEADRDCRQRKHLQTSHNGWIENGMELLFWPQVFQKGSAVETSWTPPHKEKFFSCELPVPGACAQGPVVHCNSESTVMFSCTLALGRLPSYCASVQPNDPRSRRAGGATPGPAHAPGRFAKAGHAGARLAYSRSPRRVDLPGVWAVAEPDACARSELRNFLQNQFSFCVENVRFVIFHPKLAQPPSPRFEMRYV